MQAECRNEKLKFQACGARQAVAEFNGGAITPWAQYKDLSRLDHDSVPGSDFLRVVFLLALPERQCDGG